MEAGKNFKNTRIAPSAAGLVGQNFQGAASVVSFLIRPGAGQRIVDIGDLDDSGQNRDFILPETVRISGAVPTFMMMPDDGEHRRKRFQGPADFLAADGMTPHDKPLFRGQLSGFEQNRIGNSNFSNVVQVTTAAERDECAPLEADGDTERQGYESQSFAVTRCLCVPLFN